LFLLTAIYFVASLIGILHHELWLDEAHHWLLARDSSSINELVQNTRIEGHPILWNLILYGITRFTSAPFWMQLLHIFISTTTIFIFLKKAPFDWIFKSLFIFGYFIIFEYNLISRNYNLGVLFLFLACTVFKNRKTEFSLLCLYLAIASYTHLMFSVIAFALFLTLLTEQIQDKQFFASEFIKGYFIYGFGLFFIIIQIHANQSDWLLEPINKLPIKERLIDGFGAFFKGIITIPDFKTLHFWNTNLVVNWNRSLAGILALLTYLLPLLLFFKNKKTLYFVYIGLIGTQIFFFITQRTATRFHGMTFILIIIGLWIDNYYESDNNRLKGVLDSFKMTLLRRPIILSILLIHFSSGIYAYTMDYIYPFSSAKATISYLKNIDNNNKNIITVTCDGTILSAYLQKKIYFLCDQSLQSYCHWDSSCFGNISQSNIIVMLTDYMDSHKDKTVFYVSYYSLTNTTKTGNWIDLNEKIKVRLLKKFNQNITEKSNYFVFEVTKRKHRL